MLGMASGIFIVPILTIFGHVDTRSAIGASIVSVIARSCGSASPFLKGRLTTVRLAILLETAATTAGALTGVLLVGAIPASHLFFIFGVILVLSAHQVLAKRRDPALASTQPPAGRSTWRLDSSYPDRAAGSDIAYRAWRASLTSACSWSPKNAPRFTTSTH
jgi:uncharacterized membrane protein YfcA